MRLAVISDIHGNLAALETVLADIGRRSPDTIVNLGDCVTSPLWPRETMELLETRQLPTVRGNHDRWIANPPPGKTSEIIAFARDSLTATQRTALGSLPQCIRLDDDILCVHGTPTDDTEYLLEENIDGRLCRVTGATIAQRLGAERASLVLCGHSHTQHMASGPDGVVVLNPGSVGEPRAYGPSAEATSPHARYAIATHCAGRWSVEMVALDYDWSVIVDRAESTGYPRFADGFR